MRRPRSGRIGFAVRAVRISIFGQERDASWPGHNVDCVATDAHWDGRCDRSAVGATRRAVPRVARLLAALAARDPRLFYRPLRGRGPVCLSERQTRSICTLTGTTVVPALQNGPRTRNAPALQNGPRTQNAPALQNGPRTRNAARFVRGVRRRRVGNCRETWPGKIVGAPRSTSRSRAIHLRTASPGRADFESSTICHDCGAQARVAVTKDQARDRLRTHSRWSAI